VALASLVRPEPVPETGGVAVRWLARRLASARGGALEKVTLADLLKAEREAKAAVDFDI
jgi:hypothetical protein